MKPRIVLYTIACAGMMYLASAQTQPEKRPAREPRTSVTGCLMKGDQSNEYKITANGTTYDLYPQGNVDMVSHVAHKVEITGETDRSQPASSQSSGTTAGEKRINVTSLKHLSTTCP